MPEKEVQVVSRPTPADQMIYEYLSNGSTIHAIGNYAAAVEQFKYTATEKCYLSRVIILVEDAGSFDADEYGNGITLTNGISVKVYDADDNEKLDLTGGLPIKTNANWGGLCYDADVKTWGQGNEFLLVRWTFAKAGDELQLELGDYLSFDLNDSYAGLVDHTFHIQGRKAEF